MTKIIVRLTAAEKEDGEEWEAPFGYLGEDQWNGLHRSYTVEKARRYDLIDTAEKSFIRWLVQMYFGKTPGNRLLVRVIRPEYLKVDE